MLHNDCDRRTGGRWEGAALAAAFAAAAVLAGVYIAFGHYDSDEPAGLHVAVMCSRGLVQYRDVFDNHMPLFNLIMTPAVRLAGERPDIVFVMRLAMVPVYAAGLWLAYALSRRFFSRRTALWTAAILAVTPTYVNYSLQFRQDGLWTALWVAALAILAGGEFGWRRALGAGLLLGAAAAVSMKTVMMLMSLGIAAALLPLVSQASRRNFTVRSGWAALALVCGAAAPPAGAFALFARRGALGPMYYCVVKHNVLPGVGSWGGVGLWMLCPVVLAATVAAARRIDRAATGKGLDGRFTFLCLAAGAYLAVLSVWPLVRPQTTLPLIALAAVLVVGAWLEWGMRRAIDRGSGRGAQPSERAGGGRGAPVWMRMSVVALAALAGVAMRPPRLSNPAQVENTLSQVIGLTGRSDYVLDAKGETVFRRRPFYYSLERMTGERMGRGLIRNDIVERLVETRTCVAGESIGRFPADVREFIKENFLEAGRLYVAGRVLEDGSGPPAGTISFTVAIPARYAVMTGTGPARGRLDGAEYDGPRELGAGQHEWAGEGDGGKTVLVWAQAAERGTLPEALTDEGK